MRISDINITLNPRSNSEAVSLGFNVARQYFMPLFRICFLSMLPIFIISLLLTCYFSSPVIASLFLWWCKPIATRSIIMRLSKLIFNQPSNAFSDIKSSLSNGLWLNLSFWRFSLGRHLYMPIQLLEQSKGKNYYSRRKLIGKSTSGTASAVTIAFIHFNAFLQINLFLVVYMFFPENTMSVTDLIFSKKDDSVISGIFELAVAYGIMTIIEVFFASTGFILYLNRRMILEGWDIEVKIKKIAERLGKQNEIFSANFLVSSAKAAAKSLLLVLVISTSVYSVKYSYAKNNYTKQPTRNIIENIIFESKKNDGISYSTPSSIAINPKEDAVKIDNILSNKEISPYEVKKTYEFKNKFDFSSDSKSFNWFNDFEGFDLGWLLKLLLIISILCLIAYLIINRNRFLAMLPSRKTKLKAIEKPIALFGLDITQESLPDDVSADALQLINNGNLILAQSLLYRATLFCLINRYSTKITHSDTEKDCLIKSKSKIYSKQYDYFEELTRSWQQSVYAHINPNFEALKTLATDWDKFFGKQLGFSEKINGVSGDNL